MASLSTNDNNLHLYPTSLFYLLSMATLLSLTNIITPTLSWDPDSFDYDYDAAAERAARLRREDIKRILDNVDVSSHFTRDQIIQWSTQKRIRREIRDIPYSEWEKVAKAMNIMKFTSQQKGEQIYGDKFRNWDYMVCFHAQGAWQQIGNQNHFAPSFITWHRSFEMMYEESILAIDPTIEAVPYWDYRRDILNPQHSPVFTSLYLGEVMGDKENDFAIKNGPFAYWPIGYSKDAGPQCEEISNIWGQMRNPIHREKSVYVTRVGGSMCDYTNEFVGTEEEWALCLELDTYTNMQAFNFCFEKTFHAAGHVFVGGTKPIDGNVIENGEIFDYFDSSDTDCYSWLDSTTISKVTGNGDNKHNNNTITKFYAHPNNGCFDCAKHCDLSSKEQKCQTCQVLNNGECTIVEGKDTENKNETIGSTETLNMEDDEYIWGDMLDAICSPNDPFFYGHHINLDRYAYIWQLLQYDKRPYYLYPERDWALGINLDDISAYERPLTNVYEMYPKDQRLTHRDIFDATTLENVPYMYDDILDALLASLAQNGNGDADSEPRDNRGSENENDDEEESEEEGFKYEFNVMGKTYTYDAELEAARDRVLGVHYQDNYDNDDFYDFSLYKYRIKERREKRKQQLTSDITNCVIVVILAALVGSLVYLIKKSVVNGRKERYSKIVDEYGGLITAIEKNKNNEFDGVMYGSTV